MAGCDRTEQLSGDAALVAEVILTDPLGREQLQGAGQHRGLLQHRDQAGLAAAPASAGEGGHGVAVGDLADRAQAAGTVQQRLEAGPPALLAPGQRLPGGGVHGRRQLVADLGGGHQELGGEPVGLLLDRPPAGLGIAVHDQVAELVGDVEPLAVVIVLDRVEHDDRAQTAVERVRVDACGLGRAEHHEDTVVLEQADEVGQGSGAHLPAFADLLRRPFRPAGAGSAGGRVASG